MVFDASPRCRNDRMEVILLRPLSSIFRIIVSLNKRVPKLSMIIGALARTSLEHLAELIGRSWLVCSQYGSLLQMLNSASK